MKSCPIRPWLKNPQYTLKANMCWRWSCAVPSRSHCAQDCKFPVLVLSSMEIWPSSVNNMAGRTLGTVVSIYKIRHIWRNKLFVILITFTVICIEAIIGKISEYLWWHYSSHLGNSACNHFGHRCTVFRTSPSFSLYPANVDF